MSPRQIFIEQFSDLAGVDSDEITEIVASIDSIGGICSFFDGELISFSFSLDRDECPFLHFSIECGVPKVFFNPYQIKSFLLAHGQFPFEADELFSEFSRCIGTSVDSLDQDTDYFLSIDALIDSADQVIFSISRFVCRIL